MHYFDHEKLNVYQAAMELATHIDEIIEHFPQGRSYFSDHLQRTGTSILLNIAEGAGEYGETEKVKYYRIAKRSATECAAILDLSKHLNLLKEARYIKGRELLLTIVFMLTKIADEDVVAVTVTN